MKTIAIYIAKMNLGFFLFFGLCSVLSPHLSEPMMHVLNVVILLFGLFTIYGTALLFWRRFTAHRSNVRLDPIAHGAAKTRDELFSIDADELFKTFENVREITKKNIHLTSIDDADKAFEAVVSFDDLLAFSRRFDAGEFAGPGIAENGQISERGEAVGIHGDATLNGPAARF